MYLESKICKIFVVFLLLFWFVGFFACFLFCLVFECGTLSIWRLVSVLLPFSLCIFYIQWPGKTKNERPRTDRILFSSLFPLVFLTGANNLLGQRTSLLSSGVGSAQSAIAEYKDSVVVTSPLSECCQVLGKLFSLRLMSHMRIWWLTIQSP